MRRWPWCCLALAGCSLPGEAPRDPPPAPAYAVAPACPGCDGGSPDAAPDGPAPDAPDPAAPGLFSLEASAAGPLPGPCYGCLRQRCQDTLLSCDLDPPCREQGLCAIPSCFGASLRNEAILCVNCSCGPSCDDNREKSLLLSLLDCERASCAAECLP